MNCGLSCQLQHSKCLNIIWRSKTTSCANALPFLPTVSPQQQLTIRDNISFHIVHTLAKSPVITLPAHLMQRCHLFEFLTVESDDSSSIFTLLGQIREGEVCVFGANFSTISGVQLSSVSLLFGTENVV